MMHICVCIKQTPDSASVYIDPITEQIDRERFVQVLNAADACAVEAAVRFKEQSGGTVTVLTLGPADAEGALRAALALGADSALRLWNEQASAWGAFTIAAALAAYLQQEATLPDLILCGDASSDWSSGVVGPALAQHLDLPQLTGVVQLTLSQEAGQFNLRATRKLERGYRELVEAEPPLLISVTSALNEPRYPSLPAHLASLKAKIPVLDPHTFMGQIGPDDADEETLLELHTPSPPPRRIPAPDSTHSAFQRIGEIVAGGSTARHARLVEGTPQELAQALIDFLRAKDFL